MIEIPAIDKIQTEDLMKQALEEAKQALEINAVPVGAIVLNSQFERIGRGFNTMESPLEHAECIAIKQAYNTIEMDRITNNGLGYKNDGSGKLQGCTLITTLEPCIMCAGAILNSQIERVIFGAWDEKFGAAGSTWDLLRDPLAPYHPEVFGGVLADECGALLSGFFAKLR